MAEPIRIDGLAAFSRNLKKISDDAPKKLRLALNEAADVVVADAVRRVPRRSGRAAASVKARSTRTAVRISGGGNRAPYYPWLDFGGRTGRKRSVRRAFLPDGRYIYAAYFDKQPQFEQVLVRSLVDLVEGAGLVMD